MAPLVRNIPTTMNIFPMSVYTSGGARHCSLPCTYAGTKTKVSDVQRLDAAQAIDGRNPAPPHLKHPVSEKFTNRKALGRATIHTLAM